MTLRKKLTLLYSGLVAITLMLFGTIAFGVIRTSWVDSIDSTLYDQAQLVINRSEVYPVREFGEVARFEIILPQFDIFRASGVFVQAWKLEDGVSELRAESVNLGEFRDALDRRALGADGPVHSNVVVEGVELRVLTAPIRVEGQSELWGNVQVAASLQTLNEATRRLALILIVAGMAAVLASFMLGLVLSRQALQPVQALTAAASSISTASDLRRRLTWVGPEDELGRLVGVYNSMLNRIEHLFGVQQRLVADVSHELRTPLTSIRGHLDLIQRYGMDPSSMESIRSEVERMSRMVDDLLTLARADDGSLQIELSLMDLDTVVTRVYQEARLLAQAQNKHLSIRLAHVEPIRLMGSSDRLKQLLLNLTHNAIKFTPDGGTITLSLRREDAGTAVLEVSDTGPGIPPDAVPRIFDRFFQADPARFRPNGSEAGAGLGLAIVKWIVEAHHGSIQVETALDQGARFIVRLPAPEIHSDGQIIPGQHGAETVPSIHLPRWMRRSSKPSAVEP